MFAPRGQPDPRARCWIDGWHGSMGRQGQKNQYRGCGTKPVRNEPPRNTETDRRTSDLARAPSAITDTFRNSSQQVFERSEGLSMTNPRALARTKTDIRCGTPDCDWGVPVLDLSEQELRRCRRSFRKHCIEQHGLHPKDTGRLCWFNLEVLTLTLLDHPSQLARLQARQALASHLQSIYVQDCRLGVAFEASRR
jgi:hypothetical protein